jgi:hypothetical protein
MCCLIDEFSKSKTSFSFFVIHTVTPSLIVNSSTFPYPQTPCRIISSQMEYQNEWRQSATVKNEVYPM